MSKINLNISLMLKSSAISEIMIVKEGVGGWGGVFKS